MAHVSSHQHVSVDDGATRIYNIAGSNTYQNNDASGSASQRNGHIYGDVHVHHASPQANDPDAEIRKALYETDPETDRLNLMRAKGRRVTGTCEWIIGNEKFRSWVSGDTPVLFICGGPGKGKTMLTDFIIDHLERTELSVTLYFFCLNADAKRNNIASILRGLVYQLIRLKPTAMKTLKPYLAEAERRQAVLSSPDTLWSILLAMLDQTDMNALHCVLDGIDECDDETWRFLSETLLKYTNNSETKSKLRMAILSRPLIAFNAFEKIRLDPDHNEQTSNDLDIYIRNRIEQISWQVELDHDFITELHRTLAERANGTFLWIGFATEELLKSKTQTSIEDTLARLPAGLPAIYARMLSSIPEKLKKRSALLLRWVALAFRPLLVEELAMVFNPSLQQYPSPEHLREVRDVVQECSPIVKDHSGTISLVHQSARDYLTREEVDDSSPGDYWQFDSGKANVEILRTCVSHNLFLHPGLNFCRRDDAMVVLRLSDVRKHRKLVDPFFDYAVDGLLAHAKLVVPSQQSVFRDDFFFQPKHAARTTWAGYKGGYSMDDSAGELACSLKVLPWLQYLLENTPRKWNGERLAHTSDFCGHTLLMKASSTGNTAMAELLLKQGARVNAKYLDGYRPIHFAVRSRSLPTIRLLMEYGASVDAVTDGNPAHTALTLATKCRMPDAVDYLLAQGAQANGPELPRGILNKLWRKESSPRECVRPLIEAVACDQAEAVEILQRLLLARANVELKVTGRSNVGQIALRNCVNFKRSSSCAGFIPDEYFDRAMLMMKLLLDHKTDVTMIDYHGNTPLHTAARRTYDYAVSDDLRQSSRIKSQDVWVRCVFEQATSRYETISSNLIAHGADDQAKDSHGNTPADVLAIEMKRLEERLPFRYRYYRYVDLSAFLISVMETPPPYADVDVAPPPGWERRETPSGRPYYAECHSRQNSPNHPIGGQISHSPMSEVPLPKSVDDPALPIKWESRCETVSGRTYYVDHNSRQTTWLHPVNEAFDRENLQFKCVGRNCSNIINGVRHQCLDCADINFCNGCIMSWTAREHMNHRIKAWIDRSRTGKESPFLTTRDLSY